MKAALFVSLLLSTVALAGCSGGADTAPEGDGPGEGSDEESPAAVQAPVWQVGDHWTYTDSFGTTFDLVVSSDQGSDYVLDTDTKVIAFVHDRLDELSYVGPIRKSDLAGQDSGERVRFLDFPLADNHSWSLSLEGEDFEAVATEVGDGRYEVQVSDGEVVRHRWLYDNATRFFEWMSFGDVNGTESYRIDLQASGSDWTGDLVRVEAESFLTVAAAGPDSESGVFSGWSPPAGSEVWLRLVQTCQEGEAMFSMGAIESIPNSNGVVEVTDNGDGGTWANTCPHSVQFIGIIGVEPENGTWGYTWNLASQDATLAATAWLAEYERITL